MAGSRSRKRSNPLTLLLGLIALLGFLFYTIQPSRKGARLPSPSRATAAVAPPTKAPPIVHYQINNITATADPLGNRERVLILTPLARFYDEYWQNLLKLDYPGQLIE